MELPATKVSPSKSTGVFLSPYLLQLHLILKTAVMLSWPVLDGPCEN